VCCIKNIIYFRCNIFKKILPLLQIMKLTLKKMNMKKQSLFFVVLALVSLTSCTVFKTNTSKTMDIYGAGVIQTPVLVDLDVKDTKVTGTATAVQGKSLEPVKQDAVADALKKSNADVLVEPKFETETSGGRITATVTGFPATYKNFRTIKADDVPLLKVGVTQKADVAQPATIGNKKGAATGVIVGSLLGLVLIIAVLAATL
jgi:hypothetical protein